MADPDSERAPLLRNTSEPSAPPAYSAYGDEGGIRKKTSQISVSMFNNLTSHTSRIINRDKLCYFLFRKYVDQFTEMCHMITDHFGNFMRKMFQYKANIIN